MKFQFSILPYQKHTRTSFFFPGNNSHFGFQSVSIALLWNWVPPFPPPHPFGHHQKTLAFRREKWDHHDLTYLHTFKPSVAGVVQWALSTCRSVGLLVWTQEKTNRIISVFDSLLKSLKQHPIIYITSKINPKICVLSLGPSQKPALIWDLVLGKMSRHCKPALIHRECLVNTHDFGLF